MIKHISIENFAVIEKAEIDFDEGFSVITGETGSGKSVVIEAISLALGSRADSSFVRHGADKAVVQLAADLDGEEIAIRREISASGRNLCRLNGEVVTLAELSKVCARLAEIHGQYDNQTLLDPETHMALIDGCRRETIAPLKEAYRESYDSYIKASSALKKLLASEAENARRLDYYRYEKAEIDKAVLRPGEYEELTDRISVLQNSEKIFSSVETASSAIGGDAGALETLGAALSAIRSVASYSSDLEKLLSDAEDIYYRLQDVESSLNSMADSMSFEPGEIDGCISRIDLIDNLRKKYGSTIEEILAYRDKISAELDVIENFDEEKSKLADASEAAKADLMLKASALSKARHEAASSLTARINSELSELNFSDAKVEASFTPLESAGPDGDETAEFLISANRGEPLKPLSKTASGGEMSRIMLAIRNITGETDRIPTFIFDEIDAGISGVTASIVGRKLKRISESHQIICITHLPQIAAMGDTGYRIHKENDEASTYTHIEKLSEDEKTAEIARLLGGDNITETTLKSARELIESAK
ncbi:MAG TPA: DNA repair protein RecN [Candidatus Avanaerovorax faecigallinarum]|nr:DNA repair protein RecN [Candidatus Avanaerovorax faecigallinarum]